MPQPNVEKLRVLVVDDSALYRKVVKDILAEDEEVEVVGVAMDGQMALKKTVEFKPDLLTLDIEMPKMGGLEVLGHFATQQEPPGVVILSALTSTGAKTTNEALKLGAFDFVLKPETSSIDNSTERVRERLQPVVDAFKQRLRKKLANSLRVASSLSDDSSDGAAVRVHSDIRRHPPSTHDMENGEIDAVAIGISTGGPKALTKLLPDLPKSFDKPIFIVQHMPPIFTASLAEDLNRICPLEVCEAEDGQPVVPGKIYIAPGGKQMKVARENGLFNIRITNDPPERSCKPSADYLFRSIANVYGEKVLAVIMTGMGDDGFVGTRLLRRKSALVVAQDEESCVVYGMPRVIVEDGLADRVVPLDRMAETIVELASKGDVLCK